MFARGDHRNRVVIGKDTRLSGYMLEPALTAGFVSAGMSVMLVGPMPTPAVAFLTRSLRADLGRHDLGVAQSLPRQRHQAVRPRRLQAVGRDRGRDRDPDGRARQTTPCRPRASSAARSRIDDARGRYIESLKSSFPRGLTLDGFKLVVDTRPRRRLPPRRRPVLRAGRGRGPARRRAQRAQHQRRLRLERAGAAARGGPARTAPIWASRSTATPTGWSWSTTRGG